MQQTPLTVTLLNKVPQVTMLFWIVKIMTTTVGETAADFLNFNLGLGLVLTTLVTAILLSLCLHKQVSQTKYTPSTYWATVSLISVFGTLVTDNLTDSFHIPLIYSSVVFSVILIATFLFWYKKEGTLSIKTIYAGTREQYYWLAIFSTFALGTAVGDLVAEQLNWGYMYAGLVFASLIAVIALTNRVISATSSLCFWLAYILTRPLGASIGDLLTQPQSNGGMGIDSFSINLLFIATIILIVSYFTIQDRKMGKKADE